MKSTGGKVHFYPGNTEKTQKGYCKTACGRDGYIVGGLIFDFFRTTHIEERCKTCDKVYLLKMSMKKITELQNGNSKNS